MSQKKKLTVSQEIQPLFDAPDTINFSRFATPRFFVNSVEASIALTTAFVIGNCSKILGSLVLSIKLFQV